MVGHLSPDNSVVTHDTIAAYDTFAKAYRDGNHNLPDYIRSKLDDFVEAVGEGGRVLEIGSGGARDAAYLEKHGLHVRRTDVTPAFVDLLRHEGHTADLLDPLHDNLSDPVRPGEAYDAVWANACLLHVKRADLPTVLQRLRAVTRQGGLLRFSVKEGEGEAWSEHGLVAAPRLFVYWSEPDLRAVVQQSGWTEIQISRAPGQGDDRWLEIWAQS